jgi:hypothetical protein
MVEKQDVAIPEDYAKQLLSGIAESRATTIIAGGGKDLLRMLKSGEWVFGASNEEVQPGSRWVVNIMTLAHGWNCWVDGGPGAKNELRGEVMVSMTKPKPACPPAIDGTPFKEQRSFDLKCLDGADAGTEVLFKVGSIGGMRAVDTLLGKIHGQLANDPVHACPVLVFGTDHYDHNKWGRIYTPVLEIVGWADMNGKLAGAKAPVLPKAEPEVAAAAPTRKRKPPVAAELAPAPEPAPAAPPAAAELTQPVSTVQARVGQRKRPVAR